jgi:hypothetical protein
MLSQSLAFNLNMNECRYQTGLINPSSGRRICMMSAQINELDQEDPTTLPPKNDNSDNQNDQSGEAVNEELESLEKTAENNLATHPEDVDNEEDLNDLPEVEDLKAVDEEEQF